MFSDSENVQSPESPKWTNTGSRGSSAATRSETHGGQKVLYPTLTGLNRLEQFSAGCLFDPFRVGSRRDGVPPPGGATAPPGATYIGPLWGLCRDFQPPDLWVKISTQRKRVVGQLMDQGRSRLAQRERASVTLLFEFVLATNRTPQIQPGPRLREYRICIQMGIGGLIKCAQSIQFRL